MNFKNYTQESLENMNLEQPHNQGENIRLIVKLIGISMIFAFIVMGVSTANAAIDSNVAFEKSIASASVFDQSLMRGPNLATARNGCVRHGNGDWRNFCLVGKGNSGVYVKAVQTILACQGYNPGPIDGIFGNQTRSAVIKYQRARGLSADGLVGTNTWNSLQKQVQFRYHGYGSNPITYYSVRNCGNTIRFARDRAHNQWFIRINGRYTNMSFY